MGLRSRSSIAQLRFPLPVKIWRNLGSNRQTTLWRISPLASFIELNLIQHSRVNRLDSRHGTGPCSPRTRGSAAKGRFANSGGKTRSSARLPVPSERTLSVRVYLGSRYDR